MATLAQRLTEIQVLQSSGKGLIARVKDDTTDVIYVKDPDYIPPTKTAVNPWTEFAGGDAQTAYGL